MTLATRINKLLDDIAAPGDGSLFDAAMRERFPDMPVPSSPTELAYLRVQILKAAWEEMHLAAAVERQGLSYVLRFTDKGTRWSLHVGIPTEDGGYSIPQIAAGKFRPRGARALFEPGYAVAFRYPLRPGDPGEVEALQRVVEVCESSPSGYTVDISPVRRRLAELDADGLVPLEVEDEG